jgi:dTDP-glucose pyrophosphorylase
MGGKGLRFKEAGYTTEKPSVILTDRHSNQKLPMIVAALADLPGIHDERNSVICIDRQIFAANGTEAEIKKHFPRVHFIHDQEAKGQGQGCLLARPFINRSENILIGATDSGITFSPELFQSLGKDSDLIVFTHTGNLSSDRNPSAHSWLMIDDGYRIKELSLKKPVSSDPFHDHATTGIFWYKDSTIFFDHLEQVCAGSSRERYIDEVVQFSIEKGLTARFMDVDYYCWGTPEDYEAYERTLAYWSEFRKMES